MRKKYKSFLVSVKASFKIVETSVADAKARLEKASIGQAVDYASAQAADLGVAGGSDSKSDQASTAGSMHLSGSAAPSLEGATGMPLFAAKLDEKFRMKKAIGPTEYEKSK